VLNRHNSIHRAIILWLTLCNNCSNWHKWGSRVKTKLAHLKTKTRIKFINSNQSTITTKIRTNRFQILILLNRRTKMKVPIISNTRNWWMRAKKSRKRRNQSTLWFKTMSYRSSNCKANSKRCLKTSKTFISSNSKS
jgi:hypothetical protein